MFRGTHNGEFAGVGPTGKKFESDVMDFMIVRDGKITYHRGMPRLPLLMRQILR